MAKPIFATAAAQAAIGFTVVSFALLLALHVLSREFDPSFRMVSEYAYGHYKWVLSLMFLAGGLNSWALAAAIWTRVKTRRGKIGLWFLLLAGLGSAMASVFDITRDPGHSIAGFLGIGCMPVAALLLTGDLRRLPGWEPAFRVLRWLAHLTWISIVLLGASMIIMTTQLMHVYGKLPEHAPSKLPAGVIGLVGWADRLILLAAFAWVTATAWTAIKTARSK